MDDLDVSNNMDENFVYDDEIFFEEIIHKIIKNLVWMIEYSSNIYVCLCLLILLVVTNLVALYKMVGNIVICIMFTTTKYTYYNKSYYNKNDYCGNTHTITSIH